MNERPNPLHRRRPIVVGSALIALGALLLLLMDERLIPRMMGTYGLVLGTGVGLFGWGVVGWLRARPAANRQASWIGAFAAVAVAAFATYSLGFYWKETLRICGEALYLDTLDAREARLAVGRAHRSSVFSILPELVGFRVNECDYAEQNLKLLRAGVCPTVYSSISPSTPCACGAQRWPDDCPSGRGYCEQGSVAGASRLVCKGPNDP